MLKIKRLPLRSMTILLPLREQCIRNTESAQNEAEISRSSVESSLKQALNETTYQQTPSLT